MRAIGLMSGTSMDGVDVALIETDGERIKAFGPADTYGYSPEESDLFRAALASAKGLSDRTARPDELAEAETCITRCHARAVEGFLRKHGLKRQSIGVVGFHGQTVLHKPEAGLTVQLGDGAGLAETLGIDVVHDFRAADMAAGGQGAPLVPVYHRALAERAGLPRPVVMVNLGGVANITFIDEDGELLAFDTGPGNAMIDDWVRHHTGKPRDEMGRFAARGKTDHQRLEKLLGDPYFLKKPPKSLDRNAFSLVPLAGMALEDGAATLTAFTVAALICALAHLPAAPKMFILSGGGTRNATLLSSIRKLAPGRVETADELGGNADALEAQAFAYLAVRSLKQLPLTFPGTTGAPHPSTGGVLARAGTLARPVPEDAKRDDAASSVTGAPSAARG